MSSHTCFRTGTVPLPPTLPPSLSSSLPPSPPPSLPPSYEQPRLAYLRAITSRWDNLDATRQNEEIIYYIPRHGEEHDQVRYRSGAIYTIHAVSGALVVRGRCGRLTASRSATRQHVVLSFGVAASPPHPLSLTDCIGWKPDRSPLGMSDRC